MKHWNFPQAFCLNSPPPFYTLYQKCEFIRICSSVSLQSLAVAFYFCIFTTGKFSQKHVSNMRKEPKLWLLRATYSPSWQTKDGNQPNDELQFVTNFGWLVVCKAKFANWRTTTWCRSCQYSSHKKQLFDLKVCEPIKLLLSTLLKKPWGEESRGLNIKWLMNQYKLVLFTNQ